MEPVKLWWLRLAQRNLCCRAKLAEVRVTSNCKPQWQHWGGQLSCLQRNVPGTTHTLIHASVTQLHWGKESSNFLAFLAFRFCLQTTLQDGGELYLYDNETKEQKMPGGLPMQVWHAPTAKETCNAASRVCVLPTGAAYFSDFPRFSCSGVSRCGSVSPLTLESLLILWDPSVSLPNSVNVLEPARTDVHGITTQNRSIVYSHVNYSEENSWLRASGSRTKI